MAAVVQSHRGPITQKLMETEKETLKEPHRTDGEAVAQASENASKDAPSALPEDLTAAYQKLLAEKQEFYELALRKQAELENFRKRTQREKEEFHQHANAELMHALLPVLDGFDRALKHRDPAGPAQFYHGLELIHRQLLETLARAGLVPFESKGETFDPKLHQAVEMMESDRHRDHEVVEELQRGYMLKQRLLRPAVVKVAIQSAKSEKPSESPDEKP